MRTTARLLGVGMLAHTGSPHPRGPYYNFATDEVYAMATLRPHPGRWTLTLFLDEVLVGTYPFVLADKAHIGEFRRGR